MSDLSELFHYIIIWPLIYIILSELLNFLCQTISTMLWKTWEHFRGNSRVENSGDVLFASRSSDNVSICDMINFVFGVTDYLWTTIIAKLHSFIHELLKLLRRDNVTSGGCNPLMSVTRSTEGRNENQDSDRREVSIPDANLRRLRSGRVYDTTPVLKSLPIEETHHASGDNPQSSDNVSICDMIIFVFGVTDYLWTTIIAKLHSFIHELLKLLRRDNVTSGGCNPLMSVTRSTEGRNENQDSDRREVSIPDANLRRLRSGRVYDITPLSNSLPIETHHASGDNPRNGRSSSASGSSSFTRRRRANNWFGDSYRIRQEERIPDRVQRYGRPSSLLTSSSSPAALPNILSSLTVIESARIRSANQE